MMGRRTATYDGVTYAPGARFMVVGDGARLTGQVYAGSWSWSGWGQKLEIGDVLTCTGDGPSWGSDPGYGVEWTTPESEQARASHCELKPSIGGMAGYRPKPGLLTPVFEGGQRADQLTYYVRRTRPGQTCGFRRVSWTRVTGARQAQKEAAAWRADGWAAWVVRSTGEVRFLVRLWQRRAKGTPGVVEEFSPAAYAARPGGVR